MGYCLPVALYKTLPCYLVPQADTIFDFLRGDAETVGFLAFHEGYKRITDFASDHHHRVAHHMEWYVLPQMPGGGLIQAAIEQGKSLAKPVIDRSRGSRPVGDAEALLEGEGGGGVVGGEQHWWASLSSFLLVFFTYSFFVSKWATALLRIGLTLYGWGLGESCDTPLDAYVIYSSFLGLFATAAAAFWTRHQYNLGEMRDRARQKYPEESELEERDIFYQELCDVLHEKNGLWDDPLVFETAERVMLFFVFSSFAFLVVGFVWFEETGGFFGSEVGNCRKVAPRLWEVCYIYFFISLVQLVVLVLHVFGTVLLSFMRSLAYFTMASANNSKDAWRDVDGESAVTREDRIERVQKLSHHDPDRVPGDGS